jgi:protein phosphatase
MHAVFFTFTGPVRERNEDALLCRTVLSGKDMKDAQLMELEGMSVVAAVADGVGGEPGGAEAARLVLEALLPLSFQRFGESQSGRLEAAVVTALSDMASLSDKRPELTGMAATLAGVWTDGERALLFNCGDCRVYRLRRSRLELLSRDHSLVYELYQSGDISFEETLTHPMRNILTSSIRDKGPSPHIFLRDVSVLRGDSYFICSDGVWESLAHGALEEILSSAPPLQAGQALCERLQGAGSRDNATFLWLY